MKKEITFSLLCIFFLIGSVGIIPAQDLVETLQKTEGQEIEIPLRPIRGSGPFTGEERTFSVNGVPLSWHGKEESLLSIQEGLDHPLTKKYLASYTSPEGKKWLSTVFRRSEPYLTFIRREIEKRQLPLEFVFLPVIESAYSPRAVSRSGATGLWQFMKNSSIYFDMKTTSWIDERRDFWKATIGALEKLKENYGYFKDWPLALAAYNAGVGAIQRAMARSGAKTYWELIEKKAISTETTHYVPKFLAVAEVLSHPGRYGLDPWWPEVIEWERIPVGRMVDIAFLAEKAGIEPQWLQIGNHELTHGVTPADKNYQLKVPRMHVEAVQSVLSQKDLVLLRYYYYTIRSGDTLSALSRHYGVSVDLIKDANPGIQERYLKLGSTIKIPALKQVGEYQRPAPTIDDSIQFNGQHLVKKGETLWSIALAYDVDPEILASVNGLELTSILREGLVLKTPIRN